MSSVKAYKVTMTVDQEWFDAICELTQYREGHEICEFDEVVTTEAEVMPTCDVCGEREADTPHMEWNGDTGCHVDCEDDDDDE